VGHSYFSRRPRGATLHRGNPQLGGSGNCDPRLSHGPLRGRVPGSLCQSAASGPPSGGRLAVDDLAGGCPSAKRGRLWTAHGGQHSEHRAAGRRLADGQDHCRPLFVGHSATRLVHNHLHQGRRAIHPSDRGSPPALAPGATDSCGATSRGDLDGAPNPSAGDHPSAERPSGARECRGRASAAPTAGRNGSVHDDGGPSLRLGGAWGYGRPTLGYGGLF